MRGFGFGLGCWPKKNKNLVVEVQLLFKIGAELVHGVADAHATDVSTPSKRRYTGKMRYNGPISN